MRLPVTAGGVAKSADEAAAMARGLGFPVAVKLASHDLVHKTEVGGVHLGLADEAAVRHAFEEIGVVWKRKTGSRRWRVLSSSRWCTAGPRSSSA